MSRDLNRRKHVIPEQELLDIEEEIKELRTRVKEDGMVGELLFEEDNDRHAKKKLKELKKIINDIHKQLEKAEHLLREVIQEREKENQKIEDAILLSDGVMKVKEEEEDDEAQDVAEEETTGDEIRKKEAEIKQKIQQESED